MRLNDIFSNITKYGNAGNASSNVVQIEDNNYIFDVFLWNGETRVGITFANVEELKIVDDLRYFFSYGYMLFSDNNDVLESFGGKNAKGYNFRGDGRDYLQVEIMPQLKPNDENVQEVSEQERKEFCLKYTFSIYKIDEELREDKGVKFKKIYFWDVDYQLLNEIDARSSSSEVTIEDNNGIFGLIRNPFELNSLFSSNNQAQEKNLQDNKRYTGDILKYIFDKSLNKICQSGFRASSNNWDKGSSLIEFHTNGTNKAIDDIEYLLSYHTSTEENDYAPCILKKTRYSEDYTFIPMTKYLEYNVAENFVLGKLDTSNGSGIGSILNFGSNQSNGAFNAINYNIIENYSFLKPDADIVQEEISTHFVHSYDPKGFFTCSIKNNNIKSSEKSFLGLFNSGPSSGSNGYGILPKNQIREENFNVQHKYASGLGLGENMQKLNSGRNKSLIASIFKSSAIYFRIRGLTRRRSGTMISINRNDNQTKNDNDKMILGNYFTTMVIHEFTRGTYFNHIYATKQTSGEQTSFAKML